MLEENLIELDKAQKSTIQWQLELAQLHNIYKTKPSISFSQIDKIQKQVYYLIEYMKVLTREALAGTIPSTLSEIVHNLDPEVAKLLFEKK